MKRVSLWFAVAIVLAHVAMRALGLGAHMSILAGMPIDATSYLIAPVYFVVYLLAVTVAPVLAIAGVIDLSSNAST